MGNDPIQGGGRGTYVALETSSTMGRWDRPPRREAQGDGAAVVLGGRESRSQGEGRQVSGDPDGEVREMRDAETVLGIIHDRGKRGRPSPAVLEDTGEPGAPKGARPVRRGAVGKVPVTATR
jgi:hypothetical protein